MLKKIWHIFDPFFPEVVIFSRPLSPLSQLLSLTCLTIFFSLITSFVPIDSIVGFDWKYFFSVNNIPPFYPPWTIYIGQILTYPLLIGLTISATLLAVFQRSVHIISAVAAIICLPIIWTIFLGQLEGLVVLGMLGLPWLVPLVLIKPQISLFGLGARRSYILAFLLFMIISVSIWGYWPAKVLAVETFYAEGRYDQNIAIGWYGLPLFLTMVWFSRGDMDMLMACGAFISPHVIVYNLLPLTPAVARLRPKAAIIALIFSFLTLLSNFVGPNGWWLGWMFIGWLWINLAAKRYPMHKLFNWVNILVGRDT